MYLSWSYKLRSKKILKKIYKKYRYNILYAIFLNSLNSKYNYSINKLNAYIIKVIRFKRFIIKVKKKLKKKKLKKKKYYKHRLKKRFKKNFKNLILSIKNIKYKVNELIYFLKYFLVFKKRDTRLHNLARLKSKLAKKKFFRKKKKIKKFNKYLFKRFKYLSHERKKHINLANIIMYYGKRKRHNRLHRVYDIGKKCIRYLNNNRSLYKIYKFRAKHNFKFIKRHIRSISALSIKSRLHMFEYSLRSIAIKLKYAYTYRNASMFVKAGFIFLNGKQELNPLKFMYKGDCIELIFSKFVLKLKNKIKKRLSISMRRYKRYNWKMLKNKVPFAERRVRVSRFSEKVLHYKSKMSNIFQFDYRTLSFFLISDIRYKKDLTYLNKKVLPIYLIKLFNWKIIS